MTLQPSSYTAIVRGKNNTTGVALVEVYKIAPTNPSVDAQGPRRRSGFRKVVGKGERFLEMCLCGGQPNHVLRR